MNPTMVEPTEFALERFHFRGNVLIIMNVVTSECANIAQKEKIAVIRKALVLGVHAIATIVKVRMGECLVTVVCAKFAQTTTP